MPGIPKVLNHGRTTNTDQRMQGIALIKFLLNTFVILLRNKLLGVLRIWKLIRHFTEVEKLPLESHSSSEVPKCLQEKVSLEEVHLE